MAGRVAAGAAHLAFSEDEPLFCFPPPGVCSAAGGGEPFSLTQLAFSAPDCMFPLFLEGLAQFRAEQPAHPALALFVQEQRGFVRDWVAGEQHAGEWSRRAFLDYCIAEGNTPGEWPELLWERVHSELEAGGSGFTNLGSLLRLFANTLPPWVSSDQDTVNRWLRLQLLEVVLTIRALLMGIPGVRHYDLAESKIVSTPLTLQGVTTRVGGALGVLEHHGWPAHSQAWLYSKLARGWQPKLYAVEGGLRTPHSYQECADRWFAARAILMTHAARAEVSGKFAWDNPGAFLELCLWGNDHARIAHFALALARDQGPMSLQGFANADPLTLGCTRWWPEHPASRECRLKRAAYVGALVRMLSDPKTLGGGTIADCCRMVADRERVEEVLVTALKIAQWSVPPQQ